MRRLIAITTLMLLATSVSIVAAQTPVSSVPRAQMAIAQPGKATTSHLAPALPPLREHEPTSPDDAGPTGGMFSIVKVGGSLAVVIGIFCIIVWMLRRASPGGFGVLPNEAFEVLGRAALANRQQAQLIRCGSKLLLVSATATGANTLTEITEPAEVERLAELCRQSHAAVAPGICQLFRRTENHDAQ